MVASIVERPPARRAVPEEVAMRGLCGAAALLCIALTARADPPTTVMHIMREGELKFSPSKVVPGASNSVLWGSPAAAGQTYIVRNRFSPNTFSPPHFHPETRYVTLIKGTWWVGSGPKFDKDATTPVPAGSVVVHHANQIHWDGAKDEEVIVQIMGIGPSATIAVDEAGRPKQ
jgi:quercetin dioxygenase-like cupin family protein